MAARIRSKLFVPCSRPALFAKALAGEADAISFDLEDSVPEDSKETARQALADILASDLLRASGKTIIVRLNAVDTPHFAADAAVLAGAPIDLVNLPKIDNAAAVRHAAAALDGHGVDAPLLLNIESAAGVAQATTIAGAHPRVAGLQVGLNDLFASMGIDRADPRHAHAALWSVRLASGAAGCLALDGAWPDLTDDEGFRAEAALARSLGYAGKSCIHPRQVPIANAVFDDGDRLAQARRLLAAAEGAAREGRGAFTLDGRMVDRPMIDQARALLAGERPA
ncbi:citrate lyase subunit beta/citryl-CoA lyase [Sphingomonas jinjuensis]|uniref:Citrate lyase subunit beta/citryl-CoA lyase n=1 Tax=Sphingomonas jinjuensis TaxID=535907 RepID=A0A840FF90_9SPHN|nr:CoA ester lyase [Sphingomonas jinjuensis]MBB4155531.1 citrate lyase subunit beta/citryl-CoA lyase [Sphingomonas jinjuensis]